MEKKNLKAYVKPTTENAKMIVSGELCGFIEASIMYMQAWSHDDNPNPVADSRKKRSTVWEDAE